MARSLSWKAYVTAVEVLCRQAARPDFDHEQHAVALQQLSDRLDLHDAALVDRFEVLSHGQITAYVTSPVVKTPTCGMMLVSLVAGGKVGLHEHPAQSGFILCVRGQMQVDAYDELSDAPLRLRHTVRVQASAGDCVSLTPTRDNIHRLDCTQPTWLVDVFTPPLTEHARAGVRAFTLGEAVGPGEFLASVPPRSSDA